MADQQTAQHSIKRALIDKANSRVVAVTASACFVVVFCIVASVTLFGQLSYQNRVIGAKKGALKQAKADVQAVDSLKTAYTAFTHTSQNVIGGDPNGTGPQDGDNATIILDSLPSKYDFPALATSLEKILEGENVQIQSISGTDESATQDSKTSSSPSPQPMPFQLSVTGSYESIQSVVSTFEHSIRPFQFQTMDLSGSQDGVTLTITAQTYYQPEKSLNISSKVVQ